MSPATRKYLLLGFLLSFFFALTGVLTYRTYQRSTGSFLAGSPPINVENALLPQTIELSKMHPPALRPTDPIRFGSVTSVASVIEFGDFESSSTRALEPTMQRVLSTYHGNVRFIWRDLPVTDINPHAMEAAIFARCAGLQGKFWEAHDNLLQAKTLNELTYSTIGTALHLDSSQLQACRKDPSVQQAIQQDVDTARNDGVNSAPLLFIGTKASIGPFTEEQLRSDIKLFLAS
jgi:protein-disulfide isomerase